MAYRRRSKCIGCKNGISGCRNCCKGNKKCLRSCMRSKPRRKSRKRSRKRSRRKSRRKSRKRSKKYYKKKKSNKIKSRRKMSKMHDYNLSELNDVNRSQIAKLIEERLRAEYTRALDEGRIYPEFTVWDYLKKKGVCPYSVTDPIYREACYSESGLPVLHNMHEWDAILQLS